jgi:glutaredoxin
MISRMTRILLALALAALSTLALAQQLYRWTDKNGRVHVTDTPPPPGAKDVRTSSGGSGAGGGAISGTEPYALQMARKSAPVTFYSTRGCEACDEGRKLLNERGVPFREISVNDEKELEELKKAVGSNSVPALIVGSFVQKGFEPGAYHRALDAAGYPKTGMLQPRSQSEPAPSAPQGEAPAASGDEATTPAGPYAPGAPRQPRPQKK